ncbi:MAG: hypothetical protein GVY06_02940 [Alphaproteobacteria bacterium]|jgi:hypothetical protein|nr:hypothetical protein [Alphaproteobacteria bacterium]
MSSKFQTHSAALIRRELHAFPALGGRRTSPGASGSRPGTILERSRKAAGPGWPCRCDVLSVFDDAEIKKHKVSNIRQYQRGSGLVNRNRHIWGHQC